MHYQTMEHHLAVQRTTVVMKRGDSYSYLFKNALLFQYTILTDPDTNFPIPTIFIIAGQRLKTRRIMRSQNYQSQRLVKTVSILQCFPIHLLKQNWPRLQYWKNMLKWYMLTFYQIACLITIQQSSIFYFYIQVKINYSLEIAQSFLQRFDNIKLNCNLFLDLQKFYS